MKIGRIGIGVMFVLLAAIGITAALFLQIAEKNQSSQTPQWQVDQAGQIALARLDLEIKEAQLETSQAKTILDHERAILSPESTAGPWEIVARLDGLQAAFADYNRKSNHLDLLLEARAKIDTK